MFSLRFTSIDFLKSAKFPLRAGKVQGIQAVSSQRLPRPKEVGWLCFDRRLLGRKQYPRSGVAVYCQAVRLHSNVKLSQGSPVIAVVTQQLKKSHKVPSTTFSKPLDIAVRYVKVLVSGNVGSAPPANRPCTSLVG
jgi:hypothetical protein